MFPESALFRIPSLERSNETFPSSFSQKDYNDRVSTESKSAIKEMGFSMGLEDKDFILRQVQELAEGIGKFLGKDSIKELINYDQSQEGALSDEDIEAILLITTIRDIQESEGLSDEDLSNELGMPENGLENLYNNERSVTEDELETLRDFVAEKETY